MDQPRQPSDRIRRILQSMERSIDTARDRRLNRSRPAVPAPVAQPQRISPPMPMQRETTIGRPQPAQDEPARVKARPKRPNSGFFREWDNQGLRSKAG